ncbi:MULTISPECIES: hypothetical protein [Ectothiorhodospira]|uniref:hypothetical protein n=1 Tax=Ectothiorhodospira TaxID=1051 RepID=UPI00054D54D2|nr:MULTISPECIES: hypothetical protein [Ectothiorhodospira]MCG5493730.1 hypothetical protein [Ectothiorhodospira variabilis]MCG5497821.1 hypothetical protein [Ectothiorhodospira variabilis]MCG5503929.1 hypothetical protein [Ectothiorhodospira variabilis]MCG5507084.1 hypothetical protein [Ectothiorhodospira variabilis]MCG5524830.1 hypothetical protein [Ectothiorhodospira haloalkaliphila]
MRHRLWVAVILLGLAMPLNAAERFQDWWISYSEPDGGGLTLLAYTRSEDGHAFAIGQARNGPLKAAILIRSGNPSAEKTCCVEARVASEGRSRVVSTHIDEDQQPAGDEGRQGESVEWALWEPRQGNEIPPLMQALMEGREVHLKVEDAFGDIQSMTFSLEGARQALHWMITEGPMTVTHDTVDSLSEAAAFHCGHSDEVEACFDEIVNCWDRQSSGTSAVAFHGCLRSSGVMGPPGGD